MRDISLAWTHDGCQGVKPYTGVFTWPCVMDEQAHSYGYITPFVRYYDKTSQAVGMTP